MFIIWQCNWFADILLANGDELNLNVPKFARPFFVIRLFGSSLND